MYTNKHVDRQKGRSNIHEIFVPGIEYVETEKSFTVRRTARVFFRNELLTNNSVFLFVFVSLEWLSQTTITTTQVILEVVGSKIDMCRRCVVESPFTTRKEY